MVRPTLVSVLLLVSLHHELGKLRGCLLLALIEGIARGGARGLRRLWLLSFITRVLILLRFIFAPLLLVVTVRLPHILSSC